MIAGDEEGRARALVMPPAVRPGDLVAIVAPSSPFHAAIGWRGLGYLRERYRLRFDRKMFDRAGYLAGDDARRRAELERAMIDPDVTAIVAARGGYGALRIVDGLPWEAFARSPKWFVGFSDITALHVEAARAGVASLHAPNLTALGGQNRRASAAWIDTLENPTRARVVEGLRAVVPGTAQGTLTGGNLALLQACAAAGRLQLPPHSILFLEDVTERPYRVDRMLTTLLVGGHLRDVRGVVLGDFTECDPGPDKVRVEDVLRERLSVLGVPIASGLPSGHGLRNDPLVLGMGAVLTVGETVARLELSL